MRFRIPGLLPDTVSAEEVRGFREARGWTVEELADAVHASPLEVSAWEAGAGRVPPEQAERIRWLAEVDAWEAEVARVRGEPCDWVRERAPRLYDTMFENLAGTWYVYGLEVRYHVPGCATCRPMQAHAERIGPRPPDPADAPDTWRTHYRRWTKRFPRWIGKPLYLLPDLAAMLALMLVIVSVMPIAVKEGWITDTTIMVIWAGGAAFSAPGRFLGKRLRRWPYLRGMLASAAGVLAGMAMWNFWDPALHLLSTPVVLGGALLTLAGGLLVGGWNRWKGEDGGDADPAADRGLPEPPAHPRLDDRRVGEMDVVSPPSTPAVADAPVGVTARQDHLRRA
ncbi:MAG TPA: helix-turn-helix transcriptional regulator [Longimicrobium sp.]|nr:helix-turn-helix transcriptional regulator [Longimicrobium sp.]